MYCTIYVYKINGKLLTPLSIITNHAIYEFFQAKQTHQTYYYVIVVWLLVVIGYWNLEFGIVAYIQDIVLFIVFSMI